MAGGNALSPTRVTDVAIQDQFTEIIDVYMCSSVAQTTLSVGTSLDDKIISVSDATDFAVGQCISIEENSHLMQALVQNISGTDISISAPVDREFTTSAVVKVGSYNMNVDGSTTSKIFSIQPPVNTKWDICRMIITMEDDNPMGDETYGGITALTNGIILRKKNGLVQNIFQINNNRGWRSRSFDVEYPDKIPSGTYAFGCRRSFNGFDKNGVVIRLDGDSNDQLQIIVQDDLTDLTEHSIVVQGHVVED